MVVVLENQKEICLELGLEIMKKLELVMGLELEKKVLALMVIVCVLLQPLSSPVKIHGHICNRSVALGL